MSSFFIKTVWLCSCCVAERMEEDGEEGGLFDGAVQFSSSLLYVVT